MKGYLRSIFVLLVLSCCAILAPSAAAAADTQVENASLVDAGLPRIEQRVAPFDPFSVAGPRGALLGTQDGSLEAWIYPWKIFSHLKISVRMKDYPIPIQVNRLAAEIDVQPDRTIITYSHANFTIRQIMAAPEEGPKGTGVLILYQFQSVRPMTVTFSLTPVMQRMWPAPTGDPPSPEWVAQDGGFYILHLDLPGSAGAMSMPGAEPGIMLPYQEHPRALPLQFVLHFDPVRDHGQVYPLLMAVGSDADPSAAASFARQLGELDAAIPAILAADRSHYEHLLQSSTSIETPNHLLNEAFQWAEVAMNQLDVDQPSDPGKRALVAGLVSSGNTARPGFGWFFGRDSLWSLYAIDSYGGDSVARQELDFLARHQRADGKIMHERSQTANLVNWGALPYEWASADATPLFLMAAEDYFKISGDSKFIGHLWNNLQRAWRFERAHDSDGDGIYDNSQGTGWVESWPVMPHQEIYLAALDEQASLAFASLAEVTSHTAESKAATETAHHIAAQIEKEYYLPGQHFYAFSHNANGSTDNTATIFPSVAWWNGDFSLTNAGPMFDQWASSRFSTDWGTRILDDHTSFYNPISYHQGSVWPLFTGWVSVAEYRAGRPLSGYEHLMQNADLTFAQDPGDVTELLSGKFYRPLGRSTAHQLWSSAMVISPVLRGLFGIEWDAGKGTLTVTPHLPAGWDRASIRNLPFESSKLDLTMVREKDSLRVTVKGGPPGLRLRSRAAGARIEGSSMILPLPPVEAGFYQPLPSLGSTTADMKVLDEKYGPDTLTLRLSAPAGTNQTIGVWLNQPSLKLTATGADLRAGSSAAPTLAIAFPSGSGYTEKTVTLAWHGADQ